MNSKFNKIEINFEIPNSNEFGRSETRVNVSEIQKILWNFQAFKLLKEI